MQIVECAKVNALFVLLSAMEAHNIGVDWVLEILERRLKDAPKQARKEAGK